MIDQVEAEGQVRNQTMLLPGNPTSFFRKTDYGAIVTGVTSKIDLRFQFRQTSINVVEFIFRHEQVSAGMCLCRECNGTGWQNHGKWMLMPGQLLFQSRVESSLTRSLSLGWVSMPQSSAACGVGCLWAEGPREQSTGLSALWRRIAKGLRPERSREIQS